MNDAVEGLNQIKGWSGEFNNTSFRRGRVYHRCNVRRFSDFCSLGFSYKER